MGDRMTRGLVIDALRMAWFRRRPAPGLIFHSDRGSQGVFNRWSQHWVYWPDFRYSFKASLGVFQPSVFRGLLFSA